VPRRFPKINLPVEGVPHARELEKAYLELEATVEAQGRVIERLLRSMSTGGRQTTEINNAVRRLQLTENNGGLPPGGVASRVLRKESDADGDAVWTPDWQGLMPEVFVELVPGAPTFEIVNTGSGSGILPDPEFDDDGHTLLPWPVDMESAGQRPYHLGIQVYPTFDGEEFTVWLPWADNVIGATAPFYTLELRNTSGTYGAVVNILGDGLYYSGTDVPVNGDAYVWNLPAAYAAGWHVSQAKGFGTAALPVIHNTTGELSDQWWVANVKAFERCLTFEAPGAASVGAVGPEWTNDTPGDLVLGKVRATVPAAITGADYELDVLVGGVSVGTAVIAVGDTTGAVVPTGPWTAGGALTFDVTQAGSASDVSVQVWAG